MTQYENKLHKPREEKSVLHSVTLAGKDTVAKTLSALDLFVKTKGRLPHATEWAKQYGLPTRATFETTMGMTWREYAEQRYPELLGPPVKRWDKESIITVIEQFVQVHGRIPLSKEMSVQYGLPSCQTFTATMGSTLGKYAKLHYPELKALRVKRWNKESIACAVEHFVQTHRRLPVSLEFKSKNGLPSRITIKNIMGAPFGDYAKKHYPDLAKQRYRYTWSPDSIASAVEQFIQIYGRPPIVNDMTLKFGLPTLHTFTKTMGMTLKEYTEQNYPEFEEIAQCIRSGALSERSEWNLERLFAAVEHFTEQHGRLPLAPEFTPENNLPYYTSYCNIAARALTVHMEYLFRENIAQGTALQEDAAEVPERQGPSFGAMGGM